MLYTKHSVYFGITCFDSDPKKVVTTQLRHDITQHLDDYFEIVIYSAHDLRNAYVFQITPLGTQRDALITEEDQSGGDDDGDGITAPTVTSTSSTRRDSASPAWRRTPRRTTRTAPQSRPHILGGQSFIKRIATARR